MKIPGRLRSLAAAIAAFAVLGAALVAPDAMDQGGGQDPGKVVNRLDRDGDGKVSRDEFPRPARIFDLIDRDGDGFLTVREFAEQFRRRDRARGSSGGGNRGDASLGARPARTTPGLYFIDAHSQMDQNVDGPTAIGLMDRGGVYRTIRSARTGWEPEQILALAKQRPARIIPAVTTKKWGYVSNSVKAHVKYYDRLSWQLRTRKFRGMAEVLLWHSGCRDESICPAVEVETFDQRVKAALKGPSKTAGLSSFTSNFGRSGPNPGGVS